MHRAAAAMPLKLIHGPPNSGRAGLVRRALIGGAGARPGAGRARPSTTSSASSASSAQEGAILGASVMTFGGLFRTVADRRRGAARRRADRRPSACGAVAVGDRRAPPSGSGPLRALRLAGPASRGAFERLLDELQGAGLEPARRRGGRRDARGLRLPRRRRRPLRRLRRGPRPARPGRQPRRSPARRSRLLRRVRRLLGRAAGLPLRARRPHPEPARPGRALAAATEVTVALPYEDGNRGARGAGRRCSESLRGIGVEPRRPRPRPTRRQHPTRPCSSTSSASFGAAEPARMRARRRPRPAALGGRARRGRGDRRRGRRGCSPTAPTRARSRSSSAIPARRGPLLASVLESYGIAGRPRGRGPGRRRPRSAAR